MRDGRHLEDERVSDEIESISGYPASDFIDASKRTLVSVTHPGDRDAVDHAIRAATADHRPFALEYRVLHADGGVRWVLERGVKTIDRDGSEWLDGIIFDITERRASEQLRLERETEAARIEELEASRARIIEAGDEARRRIERDLHDGAQQRLVVASLHLRTAERRTEPGATPRRCSRRHAPSSTRGSRSCASSRAGSIRPCSRRSG